MKSEKMIENFRILMRPKEASLSFIESQNTFGDSDFETLSAIESWLSDIGIRKVEFSLKSENFAERIFLEKSNYIACDLKYIKLI